MHVWIYTLGTKHWEKTSRPQAMRPPAEKDGVSKNNSVESRASHQKSIMYSRWYSYFHDLKVFVQGMLLSVSFFPCLSAKCVYKKLSHTLRLTTRRTSEPCGPTMRPTMSYKNYSGQPRCHYCNSKWDWCAYIYGGVLPCSLFQVNPCMHECIWTSLIHENL